jgi:hypothetical protein
MRGKIIMCNSTNVLMADYGEKYINQKRHILLW